MEYIVILILLLIILLAGYYIFNINMKKMKEVRNNKILDEITERFPENIEICKDVLKSLNNSKVKIKEEKTVDKNKDKKTTTSLYVVITDTIFIGNIKDTYTRIQTVCHECLHSIQPRKLLLFNFIYSNIYILYFFISTILCSLDVFKDIKLQIIILSIMSFLYYIVRSYLETDAMIKAKFLSKDYMYKYIEEKPICTKKEVDKIVNEYDRINKFGIPAYNYVLFFKCILKISAIVIIGIVKKILYIF